MTGPLKFNQKVTPDFENLKLLVADLLRRHLSDEEGSGVSTRELLEEPELVEWLKDHERLDLSDYFVNGIGGGGVIYDHEQELDEDSSRRLMHELIAAFRRDVIRQILEDPRYACTKFISSKVVNKRGRTIQAWTNPNKSQGNWHYDNRYRLVTGHISGAVGVTRRIGRTDRLRDFLQKLMEYTGYEQREELAYWQKLLLDNGVRSGITNKELKEISSRQYEENYDTIKEHELSDWLIRSSGEVPVSNISTSTNANENTGNEGSTSVTETVASTSTEQEQEQEEPDQQEPEEEQGG